MARDGNYLETDDTILEKNLRFVKNDLEDNFKQLFSTTKEPDAIAPPRDYKLVLPQPGLCIKSYKVNTNEKYFVNICITSDIPPPEDVTEEQLVEILKSPEPGSYRVPMSISEPRTTNDKSNNTVDVCDIAIHPQFLAKISKSQLFHDFFMTIITEALNEKYNVQIDCKRLIILNNRKCIGNLIHHRIRNSDVKTVLTSYQSPSIEDKAILSEFETGMLAPSGSNATLVEEIDSKEVCKLMQKSKHRKNDFTIEPEYQLCGKVCDNEVEEIQAEFYLPKCVSSDEITLDVGEDRIHLESVKRGYLFEKFLGYNLQMENAKAIFNKTNKMLQVRVPVVL